MRSEKRKNIIFFGLAFVCMVLLFAWWPGKDPARIDMEGRKDTADLIRSETEAERLSDCVPCIMKSLCACIFGIRGRSIQKKA